MKHIINILFVFFVVGILHSCSYNDGIRIGVILPLTGDAAIYGDNCRNGIELAVEEINQSGGVKGKKVELIIEDSKLQPQIAVNAFEKLVSVNKVPIVIGPLASSCAMATAPIANKYEVVSFSPGASTPKLTDAGEYVYRNWQSDALEAVVLANYAIENGFNSFSIFYVNNDFGYSLQEYFKKTVEKEGGKIIASVSFEQGALDFRPQLTKLKSDEPEAIYLLSYPQTTPSILNQMNSLKIHSQVFSVAAMEDQSIIDNAKEDAEGLIYTIAVPASENDSLRKAFISNYRIKYSKEPGLISDTGYDALYIISQAIKNARSLSGTDIKIALDEIKEYKGVSGHMTFDENGDVIKPIGIKKIINSDFIWISK
jgi:branched-chain amino acid transport system substrate-binding protein